MATALAAGVGCRGLGETGIGWRDADPAISQSPRLGRPATAEQRARLDLRIGPDGSGLPEGRGTATQGEAIYLVRCLRCHGLDGSGKPADRLVGGIGSLRDARPVKTVGSYWPYAPILFDYIRRAMPYDRPGSLSADEVYALTAYLLAENEIIDPAAEMNSTSLPAVEMPNRQGFHSAEGWRGAAPLRSSGSQAP